MAVLLVAPRVCQATVDTRCSWLSVALAPGTVPRRLAAAPEGRMRRPGQGAHVQEDIPLFPLNVVLFPGMPLPLHIFEPRYREMMALCEQEERPFGVVLIQEGREVGAP